MSHPPQNDGPVNFFMKFNGNHLLMADIFKLRKYQAFGLFKTQVLIIISTTSQILNLILFIFLNKRNITTSLLMIHFKCIVMHYANLNSSSISKPYLRAVKYAISFFFEFLFTFILTISLSKSLWKNYHF